MHAANVTYSDGKVSFHETTPEGGSFDVEFASCMANRLFTFSRVSLDSVAVNVTGSDNIGPFLIGGAGWTGGNHLNGDRRSADTESVAVSADGRVLQDGCATECKRLRVEVKNRLYHPVTDSLFCIERMVYYVQGNSIQVEACHEFVCEKPEIVERYYGMQSMMIGETETLTPGGAYAQWTPQQDVDRFTKASAPLFDTFVEHSQHGYQACHMDICGLGSRAMVDDDDVVFIGNSWTKSYHKLIGTKKVAKGDVTRWKGVYTWFRKPDTDTCRGGSPGEFAYRGYYDGRPVLFRFRPGRATEKICK